MQEGSRGATTAATSERAGEQGLGLTLKQMPETAITADKRALRAQRWYQRAVGLEQILLVAAAAAGLLALIDASGTFARYALIAALAGSLAVRLYRNAAHPDTGWYDARALAEEIQSQAWRYTMGASPYDAPRGSGEAPADLAHSAEVRFVEEARRVRESVQLHLPAAGASQSKEEITSAMKQVRDAALAQRIAVYYRDRLQDQHGYYDRKARANQRLARWWNVLILGIEGLASWPLAPHSLAYRRPRSISSDWRPRSARELPHGCR